MAQWCNLLILQPEQSGGVGSIHSPGRAPPLECHDKGSHTRLATSAIPALGAKNRNFIVNFTFTESVTRNQIVQKSLIVVYDLVLSWFKQQSLLLHVLVYKELRI